VRSVMSSGSVREELNPSHRERADEHTEAVSSHVLKSDGRRTALPNFETGEAPMARATTRTDDEQQTWRSEVAKTIERVRALSGMNLNEFADAVGRDPRQVSRWLKGEERPHIDAFFASEQLLEPLLVAFAERVEQIAPSKGLAKVTTQITIERRIA
jgi:ribosome-binding protein aMBF1 (putative translation factor)